MNQLVKRRKRIYKGNFNLFDHCPLLAQSKAVTLPLVAKSRTVTDTRPCPSLAFELCKCEKREGKKLLQTNWKIKAVDLGRLDFLYITTINHRNFSQFTFDLSTPLLFLSAAQDMTQSWASQQVLGGDPAQQMLYNSKACQCVECVCLAFEKWLLKAQNRSNTQVGFQSVAGKKVKMQNCRWARKSMNTNEYIFVCLFVCLLFMFSPSSKYKLWSSSRRQIKHTAKSVQE